MLLCVDAGNSEVTVCLVGDDGLGTPRRATTASIASATPDEVELALDGLLRLEASSLDRVDELVCASVVPAVTANLRTVAARRGKPLLIAGAETVPFPIRVDRPAEVGADRLVNALAAQREFGMPVIVVDIGTALTIDVVGRDGAFLGGLIGPGPVLRMTALASHTALLPRVDLREPGSLIGRNTDAAIRAGVVGGIQSEVAGLLARIRVELAESEGLAPATIVAVLTGGFSLALWARSIDGIDMIDPLLTFKGLAALHTESTGGAARAEAANLAPVPEGSRR